MWSLYDQLIAEVEDYEVKQVVAGLYWTAVKSKTVGLAMGAPKPRENFASAGKLTNLSVQQMAELVKSWEPLEASFGLSAINSSINCANTVDKLQNSGYVLRENLSIFDELAIVGQGKKVAVIGHFPVLNRIKNVCELTVIERIQQKGDLPDPAAEYILQDQDIVVMTSSTIINKTAPRLLQLCENAFTVMVGPSTPLTETLFQMGADMIAGLVVADESQVLQYVQQAGDLRNYRPYVKNANFIKQEHPLAQLFI